MIRPQEILACEGPISFLTYADLQAVVRDGVEGYEVYATRSQRALRSTIVPAE